MSTFGRNFVQDELQRRYDNGLTGFGGFEPYGRAGGPGIGWVNPVTGMGTAQDKTVMGRYQGYTPLDLITLASLYHGDDLAGRVIDTVPDEELRLPFKVCTDNDKADEFLASELERLDARTHLLEARRWGRNYGGAWLIPGIEDGLPASEPLRPQLAKSVDWLNVVDRRFLWPISYYDRGPKAGQPDRYVLSQTWVGVTAGSYVIHESRMIKFPGAPTGLRERNLNAGYDYSILDKCWPHLRMFSTLWKGVELLITEGPVAVYKVQGLADKLMAGEEEAMRTRFRMVEYFRSVLHAVLIDSEQESFERQPMQLAGVPDILNQAAFRVASTAQIPTMVLFGQDPAGLNATGDASLRWFWDKTASSQLNLLWPRLKHLCELILVANGMGDLVRNLKVEFEPLYTPSALERAQERKAIADTDAVYINSQALTPEEIVCSRFPEGTWSNAWTAVDTKSRKKMLAETIDALLNGTGPGMPASPHQNSFGPSNGTVFATR